MKGKQFSTQIRQAAEVNRIILPEGTRTQRTWPLCLTCFKEVDSADLVEVTQTSCVILSKCYHIKPTDPVPDGMKPFEDYYKVFFPFRIEGDPLIDERANWAIKRAMHDHCPFDPTETNEGQKRSLRPSLLVL